MLGRDYDDSAATHDEARLAAPRYVAYTVYRPAKCTLYHAIRRQMPRHYYRLEAELRFIF